MPRIERLINLIAALLEARRPLTAEEIHERIAGYEQSSHEAFRRAFERDKEALRQMGIPVELRPLDPLQEQEVGYTIAPERYYLPDVDLEPDELAALAIARDALAGGDAHAASGLLKLSVAGDASPPSGPRVVTTADVRVGDPRLGAIYAAVLERRAIEFSYTDAHGRRSKRHVEPWSLVHRAGHWYVRGRDVRAGERRTFKVARMGEAVKLRAETFVAPVGDRAAGIGVEAWEFGGDEITEVWVRFAAGARWWAEQNLAGLERAERADGALDVLMSTANADALIGWVIGWGGAVTIVSPPELRGRVREHLRPWLEPAGS
jgi:proteasome accessory factor B